MAAEVATGRYAGLSPFAEVTFQAKGEKGEGVMRYATKTKGGAGEGKEEEG